VECSNKIRDKYYYCILKTPSVLFTLSNAAYYFNALVAQRAFGENPIFSGSAVGQSEQAARLEN
jgi:hypothetical protein